MPRLPNQTTDRNLIKSQLDRLTKRCSCLSHPIPLVGGKWIGQLQPCRLATARALAKRLGKLDEFTAILDLYGRLFQRQPSERELCLVKRFFADQKPGGIDPIARFPLALINLNEFLFLDK